MTSNSLMEPKEQNTLNNFKWSREKKLRFGSLYLQTVNRSKWCAVTQGLCLLFSPIHTYTSLNIHDSEVFVRHNHSQTILVSNEYWSVKTTLLKIFYTEIFAIFKLQNKIAFSMPSKNKKAQKTSMNNEHS